MDISELMGLQKNDPDLDRLVLSVYPRQTAEENQAQTDIWDALVNSTSVKYLIVSLTGQCESQQAALLRALEANQSIEEISICAFSDAAEQRWNECFFTEVIEALHRRSGEILRKLDLCPNSGLTESSCASLSRLIQSSTSLQKLKVFVFRQRAASLLAEALQSSRVECLDLVLSTRNSRVDKDTGAVSFPFLPSAMSSMTSLKELRLMLTPHGKRLFEPEELQATFDDFRGFMMTGFSKLTSLRTLRLDYPHMSRSSLRYLSHGLITHDTIEHLGIKWEDDMGYLHDVIPALWRLKSLDLTVVSREDVRLSSLMPLLSACSHLEKLHLQDVLTRETTEDDFGRMTELLVPFSNLSDFRLSMNWDLGFILTKTMMNQLLKLVQSNRRLQTVELTCHDAMFQPVLEFRSVYDQIQHACARNRFRGYHALIKGTIPLTLFPKLVAERIDPSSSKDKQVLFDLMREINGVLIQQPLAGKRKRERDPTLGRSSGMGSGRSLVQERE